MRKLLVRLFNIIFLGLAVFAAISLGISPLVTAKLDLKITEENLYHMLVDSGVKTNIKESKDVKAPKRELSEQDEVDILNKLTAERIVYGTETAEGVGSIDPKDPFKIELPVGVCTHPRNQTVVKDFILDNIDEITWKIAEIITPKLKIVIRSVALEVANDIITEQINKQVAKYYIATVGQEMPTADKEQVNEIVNNVYDLFEDNDQTSIAELSDVLIGQTNYVLANPQPTIDNYNEKIDYYTIDESKNYKKVIGTSFNSDETYYVAEYGAGVLGVIQDLQEKNIEGFKKIDYENIDTTDIENKMVEALQTMPGLTSYAVSQNQPTGLISESSHIYYVCTNPQATEENRVYEKVTGTDGQMFDPNETYYEIIILNADDALIGLMDYYFSKATTKNTKRAAPKKEERDLLTSSVQDMIKGILPMDKINSIANKTVNRVTPLIFVGYFALLLFPWALFALVTLIRTCRKNKCWTKLWIVYVFGFIELILGVVLTLIVSKLLPQIINLAGKAIPKNYQTYVNVVKDSPISVRTNCFVASYVYLVMIVLGIIYAIIAHRVKVTHKLVKRVDKHDKKYHYDDPNYRRSSYPAYPAYPAYPQFPNYPEYPEYPKAEEKRRVNENFNEVVDDDEVPSKND